MSEELILKLNEFLKNLKHKQDECFIAGKHKNPQYFPNNLLGRNSNEVNGRCLYCLTYITRPLTEEELEEKKRFRKSALEPMF